MNKKIKIFLSLAGAIAVTLFAALYLPMGGGQESGKSDTQETGVKSKRGERAKRRSLKTRKGRVGVEAVKSELYSKGRKSIKIDAKDDVFSGLDPDELAKLNDEQKKILADLLNALSDNNRKSILRIVQKIQSSKNWSENTPKAIKVAAIDALGWFGSSCLPEIAGFLADENEEVAQSAVEKYQEALMDCDLSDRERSKILVMASQVVTDPDAMDSMMFELNNMRHSVAVDTIKQMMASGNEATKSVLQTNVEFYTGEEGMDTPEKLDNWLKENPDDEGDEEFYGGASEDK